MPFFKTIFDKTKGLYQTLASSEEDAIVEVSGNINVLGSLQRNDQNFITDGTIPSTGSDGAYHIYVTTTGSDTNDGLTPTTSFRNIQTALDRVNQWLLKSEKKDIVVEIGNGDYAENVDWRPPVQPQRRVVVRGERDSMELLASGTMTSGSTTAITDTGASFGTANELVGYILTVYDPANQSTTQQWMTVYAHANTEIKPIRTFSPAVSAGWAYRVYRPAARIVGVSTTDSSDSTINLSLPWSGRNRFTDGNFIAFVWMTFDRSLGNASSLVSRIDGGEVGFYGCLFTGARGGMNLNGTNINRFTIQNTNTGETDPVFGLSASDTKMRALGYSIRVSSNFSGISATRSAIGGPIVCHTTASSTSARISLFDNSVGAFSFGAAFYNGAGILVDNSRLSLGAGGSGLPVLFRHDNGAASAIALTFDNMSFGSIGTTEFNGLSSTAIWAKRLSYVDIATTDSFTTGCLGYGLVVEAGVVRVNNNVSLSGTLGEIVYGSSLTATFSEISALGAALTSSIGSRVFRLF